MTAISIAKARAKRAKLGPSPEPESWGFDVDDLNEEFALALMGSKAVVLHEQPDGPVEDRVRVLGIEAFRAWFLNRKTQIVDAKDGKIRSTTWAQAWLAHRDRRQYHGIEFHPDPGSTAGTEGYFNLWRGFGCAPAAKRNGYAIFRDHLLTNVCGGDQELFRWVFGWFAHIVQRPRERVGTALVLRGRMGTGKTKVGEVFGSLMPSHYFLVDDPRYLVGQFNAHMASCLLLQADEGFWAGDKAAEGRLKGLVTAEFQMIEAKGIDPIRLKNYLRLLITSNEDWVIPAGKDERRFCVIDLDPRCAQNHDYFAEMDQELATGGREALLHDLLTFDLTKVNLRQIPRTEALLEQKFRSLEPIDAWWLDRLMSGTTMHGAETWAGEVRIEDLFNDYLATSEKVGVRRKADAIQFGARMFKLTPALRKVRPRTWSYDEGKTGPARPWCYQIPPLDECRAAFEQAVNQPVKWEAEEG